MQATINLDALSSNFLERTAAKGAALPQRNVCRHSDIDHAISNDAVVAVGVSGGKDSDACALAVWRHLDLVGHTGPRVLVHSDLGRIEWADSLPSCERLAAKIGCELMVVRRGAGDMLARWQGRWANNVARYANLECMKLILPWSTPGMRFCTSELKSAVIASALKKRFPNKVVVNVTGVRRQESANRAKMPVAAVSNLLTRMHIKGWAWNAIIDWPIEDVFAEIRDAGLRLHEAYTFYGSSRVSCTCCIMSSMADLEAATRCPENQPIYVDLVELEAESGFGFQGNRWLAEVAPHLLSEDLIERVRVAKAGAALRMTAEARLPKHLLYVKGWPTQMPTLAEAEVIASVRTDVAAAVGLEVLHVTGDDVLTRFSELLAAKALKDATAALKEAARTSRACSRLEAEEAEDVADGEPA